MQSSVLLLMSCRGELPKLDAALFGDTGREPEHVYRHLEWLTAESATAGIPVVTVRARPEAHIVQDALKFQKTGVKRSKNERWGSMPFFTLSPRGKCGQVRRTCTHEYKIVPVERYVKRELLGLKRGQRLPKEPVVRQWIGYSGDETRRIRISRERWVEMVYPLVFWLTPAFRRRDCLAWFMRHYPGRELPRSACIECPFHSNAEWRDMRDNRPNEWAEAVEFDAQIRQLAGMRSQTFLHDSRVPLSEAPIDDGLDGQMEFPRQDCMGSCGV